MFVAKWSALWKRTILVSLLGLLGLITYSWVYNYPIRFRPKWAHAPASIRPDYPSREQPDNIIMAPTADMKTMAAVSWRTSDAILDGTIQYQRIDADGSPVNIKRAALSVVYSPELKRDRTVHCFAVTIGDLVPGARYRYRVGSAERDIWSEYHEFTTEPENGLPFSFVYLGDTQAKARKFAALLETIDTRHQDTAFYMIGGDLVDNGDFRNLWDSLLSRTSDVFGRKPLVPVMGNHDLGDDRVGLEIFYSYFTLPVTRDRQPGTAPNYTFSYGNTFFAVVNSMGIKDQVEWLERTLRDAGNNGYTYKVVMFHVPVYHPKANRENKAAEQYWVPLFDRYGVDLVLTGHDHSYMRSKPLINGQPTADGSGTTYVVATGCEKFYKFVELPIAARQFAYIATYQRISVDKNERGDNRLVFECRDKGGELLDRFEIVKP